MRKSKLDKLIEKNDRKRDLNYSLLENAKDELRERNARNKSVKSFNLRKFAQIFVPLSCAIIIIVVSVILLPITTDDKPALPPSVEIPPIIEIPPEIEKPNTDVSEEKHYSKTNEFRNIQSVEQLNQDKNISLRYFNLSDIEENLLVYEDKENEKDKDVLLLQSIVLLETYEEIKMFVELQDSYIIDFLHRFEDLEEKCEIGGVELKYETSFDEDLMLFCTRTTFEIDGFKYRIEFFLEDQEQWTSYLAEIL